MQVYVILIACVVLLLCLFFKVPVFISVFAGALVYFLLGASSSPAILAQRIISGTQSIPLLAIPFFICAGVFMNYTGVTKRIMNFCNALTKRMTGGLGQVNVLLSTLMGGLSGSNLADAAMEAKMLVPEMEKAGYSKEFSSVLTATSAMITPLIPPGIGMILYGSIANVSIRWVYPGFLTALLGFGNFNRSFTNSFVPASIASNALSGSTCFAYCFSIISKSSIPESSNSISAPLYVLLIWHYHPFQLRNKNARYYLLCCIHGISLDEILTFSTHPEVPEAFCPVASLHKN